MSTSSWYDSLGATLVAGATVGQQATLQAEFVSLKTALDAAPADAVTRVQRAFIGGCLTRSLSAATPGVDEVGSYLADVTSAVGGAVDMLTGPILAELDQLEGVADQLRAASDACWRAARVAGNGIRPLMAAEKLAAIAASVTGLPPVDLAWAGAADAKFAAVRAADLAAQAGRAADVAWGAVVHVIDTIREAVFNTFDSVSRVARDAVSAIANGVADAEGAAYSDLFGDFQASVQSHLGA